LKTVQIHTLRYISLLKTDKLGSGFYHGFITSKLGGSVYKVHL